MLPLLGIVAASLLFEQDWNWDVALKNFKSAMMSRPETRYVQGNNNDYQGDDDTKPFSHSIGTTPQT